MSQIERTSNVKEEFGQKALVTIVPGVILLIIGIIIIAYKSEAMVGLAWVLVAAGVGLIGYGIYNLTQMKKIVEEAILCPFCHEKNTFSMKPMSDVRCDKCLRQIPIVNGVILRVFQVQCGFCQSLNYYSEKSTGLICENCDRVIPIAVDESHAPAASFDRFAAKEDSNLYDFILADPGHKHEQMIAVLQKMLALNRNQVKQLMDEAPVVLLTGIPSRKVEMLSREIRDAGGRAESTVTST
jgi:ribosomal protein L7/L12